MLAWLEGTMKNYLELLSHVMEHGTFKDDRTGTGTKSVFGYQMRFDLAKDSQLSPLRNSLSLNHS